ncbi:MAG: NADH-quinone oxidoreductase subunit NuoI [Deferribacterota bacterium]|nr:NADH-quinone oxidoreductase subunit NuoI [Deferribacterota bacterium]
MKVKFRRNLFDVLLFTEIFQGLYVTLKHFFSKPVTEMYPYRKPRIYPRFRGIHYMKTNEKGEPKCVGCYLCARICPSECIDIETDAGPKGERMVRKYHIDLSRCIYCGFCEEACPVDAIHMGNKYNTVNTNRDKYIVNMKALVDNYKGDN